jgi:hypothetical protein
MGKTLPRKGVLLPTFLNVGHDGEQPNRGSVRFVGCPLLRMSDATRREHQLANRTRAPQDVERFA